MILRRLGLVGLFVMLVICALPLSVRASGADLTDNSSVNQLVLYLLTWLLPLGVALVAVGVSDPSRAPRVATALPLALAASLGGYYVCGFAFQFGGVGLVSHHPDLAGLIAEWSPLDLRLGPGWGLVGLRGFALPADLITEEGLLLFVSQLALVTTATLIPLVTLSGQMPHLPSLFLSLLVACVCYPLMGNWIRGGGWLAQIGTTLHLGHGYVDYGLSSLYLVGGGTALAGLIAFKHRGQTTTVIQNPELPATYLPLNVLIGAFLALIGWLVVILVQPLVVAPQSATLMILKALAAVAGATLATLFYGWVVRGAPDPGLTGRGILAALVAVGAGLPFVSAWAAALIGASMGLLLAPVMFLVERVLGLDDRGAAVSVHGFAAVWGLLAVGLFADGQRGADWNILSATSSSGVLQQSISGYLTVGLARPTGQLYAQLIGISALLILAALLPWVILTLVAQAYALPPVIREKALLRAAQIRREREVQETLRRRGGGLSIWQRTHTAYLRIISGTERRLSQRGRTILSRQTPSMPLGSRRRLGSKAFSKRTVLAPPRRRSRFPR
jgi:ammonium transporter, Amt family